MSKIFMFLIGAAIGMGGMMTLDKMDGHVQVNAKEMCAKHGGPAAMLYIFTNRDDGYAANTAMVGCVDSVVFQQDAKGTVTQL